MISFSPYSALGGKDSLPILQAMEFREDEPFLRSPGLEAGLEAAALFPGAPAPL